MSSRSIGFLQKATLTVLLSLLTVKVSALVLSQCAIDVNQTHRKAPNDLLLRDRFGKPSNNISQAWGIGYKNCTALCKAPVNVDSYGWISLCQDLTSWFLPWLALTAQLPFATRDKQTDFLALLLALGSPSFAIFSLALTIFKTRWINRLFRPIKERSEVLGQPRQIKTIKAVRVFLIESQHVPIQIFNGPRREFAHLVVCPENWTWWHSLRDEILKTKRGWTYPLYASVGWVAIPQILTIVDFFNPASTDTSIGIGLAISSLWIWMIPVVLGWVHVGTQTSAETIRDALASRIVPLLGTRRNVTGECIGTRDRSTFGDSYSKTWKCPGHCHSSFDEHRRQRSPPSEPRPRVANSYKRDGEDAYPRAHLGFDESHQRFQPPVTASAERSSSGSSQTFQKAKKFEADDCSREENLTPNENTDLERQSSPFLGNSQFRNNSFRTLLGFSIAGYEVELGSIFNCTRIWSQTTATVHAVEAFSAMTDSQREKRAVHGKAWEDKPNEYNKNLRGTPEQLSKYISLQGKDVATLSVHGKHSGEQVLHCLAAGLVTILLQWGSTGAAMIIAYK